MKTVQEIRYDNLVALVKNAAGDSGDQGKGLSKIVAAVQERGKKLSRPTLYQILSRRTTNAGAIRNVGDDLARDIEEGLKLERGWMDNDHDARPPASGYNFSPEQLADVITVFCQTTETGRKGILAAVNAARPLGIATDAANNQLESGSVASIGSKIK
ncbi:MAG TPA: hypothetical protein VGU61_19790 [Noviherbaspirillum sp.]|jgi:hypothetical protein|uniref:hypothetical protein n=1 Tax=Noviherbaspirillum sp. TaxID=1926288 RepID=UPI002DDD60E4|nr:hypothetical protein [Noviherbaspirillum sp.]HEV2612514.1 hypothetical protein [Noviherbaspirillum sp.]